MRPSPRELLPAGEHTQRERSAVPGIVCSTLLAFGTHHVADAESRSIPFTCYTFESFKSRGSTRASSGGPLDEERNYSRPPHGTPFAGVRLAVAFCLRSGVSDFVLFGSVWHEFRAGMFSFSRALSKRRWGAERTKAAGDRNHQLRDKIEIAPLIYFLVWFIALLTHAPPASTLSSLNLSLSMVCSSLILLFRRSLFFSMPSLF